MSAHGDELARLCAELPDLRAALRAAPDRRALLEQAVVAARDGKPFVERLRRLGIAVPTDDDSDAGEHGDGTEGSGDSGDNGDDDTVESTRGVGPSALPWRGTGGHVVDGVYLCPLGVCGRAHVRRPGDDLPTCHVAERPLLFHSDR